MEAIATPTAVHRECFKCKFSALTPETKCPNCSRKLYGTREIRTRGIVQVVSGLFLVVFVGGISVFVSSLLANALNDPSNAKKVQDEAPMLLAIYAIFGLVIVFGLHGVIMGSYQIMTGRRNKVLMWIMWILLFGLIFVGAAFMGLSRALK